jgi:hypothetical protein
MTSSKTEAEKIADILARLVDRMGEDILENTNSGTEDIYTHYVSKNLKSEDGSY